MMRVSRKSWHYKVWKLTNPNREPKNLCRYFWRCFFTVVIPAIVGALVMVALGFIFYLIVRNAAIVGISFGALSALVLLLFGLYYFLQWKGEAIWHVVTVIFGGGARGVGAGVRTPFVAVQKVKKREPGLIRAFLSAKKKKVCPMIEVVD